MSRSKGMGFAAAIASLATNTPKIYESYILNEKYRETESLREKGASILSTFDKMEKETELSPYEELEVFKGSQATSPQQVEMQPSATAQMAGEQPEGQGDLKRKWKEAMVSVESGGDYGAVGPQVEKLKSKGRGYRAIGKYQIMPAYHFDKIGLDSSSQSDINRFLNTPQLQDHLFELITNEMWEQSQGDPRKATALYYGSGSNAPAPKVEGGKQMPSGAEHWMKVASQMGVEPGAGSMAKASSLKKVGGEGYVTEALRAVIEDRPKRPAELTSKTQRKLQYFMSHASPEMIEAMEPTLTALQQLSKTEQDNIKASWDRYDQQADRWSRAVITAATLGAGITKKGMDASGKQNKEDIQKLRLKHQLLSNQVKLYRDVAKQYANGNKKERDLIEDQYPDLFKEKDKGFFRTLFQMDPIKAVDTFFISRLQAELDQIDKQLAKSTGLPSPVTQQGIPSTGGMMPQTSGLGELEQWITR